MAFTSLNIATMYCTSGTVVPTIRTALFSSPTVAGQIDIGSITGNFTSYTVTRNGTEVGTGQTAATYTNTSLANNTQYTYTIVPYVGGIKGTAFTTITNPNNAGTPGKIYTLASPATLALTYAGATSTTTAVSFTWIGTLTNFASLSIQYPNGTALATPVYAATTQTYTSGSSFATNTQYTYYVYAINVDGIGSGLSACQATKALCTWATAPTLTYNGAGCSTSQISFTFSGGAYTNLSVQYPSGTEITKTTTSPYTGGAFTANQQVTYYVFPINSLSYISSNSSSVAVCTLATAPTLTYNGAGSSTTQISFSFSGGTYSNLSVQYPSGTEITKTTTSPYTGGAFSANQQVTYYVYPINALSYASGTGSSVAVCTLASVNTPTFSNITSTGVTVAVGGTYTNSVVTYTASIGGSPASGTSIAYATLSAGQSYTTFTAGSNVVFVAAPVNALGYQSTNTSTATQQLTQTASFSSALFTTPTYTYNAGTPTWTNSIGSMGISTGGKVIVYSTGWGSTGSTRNPTTVWMNDGNFGKTFTSINSKLTSFQANAYMNLLLGIGVSNDGTIIILYMNSYNTGGAASATNGPGFYVSTNSGATFGGLYSSTGTTANLSPGPGQVIISSDSQWAYATGTGYYQNCFCVNKTAGNFTTWNSFYYDQQTAAKYGPMGSMAAMNSNASIIYFGGGTGNYGMCKSTDKGVSVTNMTSAITAAAGANYYAGYIACDSTGSIIYATAFNYGATPTYLLKSTNSGASFTKLTIPVSTMIIEGIVCDSTGTKVLILNGGLYATANPYNGAGINPASESSIYISTNGGGTWIASGGPNAYNPQLASGLAVDSTFTVFGLMIAQNKSNLNWVCNAGFGNGYFYG